MNDRLPDRPDSVSRSGFGIDLDVWATAFLRCVMTKRPGRLGVWAGLQEKTGRFMSRLHLTILPIAVGLAALMTHLIVNGSENPTVLTTAAALPNEFASADDQPSHPPVDFQVLIKVYETTQSESEPVAKHTVMFREGVIYDFEESEGGTITVFDTARKRVVLLDTKSSVRTQIGTKDLIQMTAQLRASAASKDIQERLGMQAKVTHDEVTDQYSIQYGSVRYTTTTQRPTGQGVSSQDCATEFGRFADWASRLNIARQLGLPPFGRMSLNGRLAADGQVPDRLSLEFDQGNTTSRYHSTHEVVLEIGETEQKRIDEVGSMIALYRDVPLKSFSK